MTKHRSTRGVVSSITIVALQLTSSQFSPRALRTFPRDRVSQVALGMFVATFVYAFTALSAVRVAAGDDDSFVPAITVTGAFALMGARASRCSCISSTTLRTRSEW